MSPSITPKKDQRNSQVTPTKTPRIFENATPIRYSNCLAENKENHQQNKEFFDNYFRPCETLGQSLSKKDLNY